MSSSTKIRNPQAVGDFTTVNRFLGYSYSVTGEVVYGHHLGHKIGFPQQQIFKFPTSGECYPPWRVRRKSY